MRQRLPGRSHLLALAVFVTVTAVFFSAWIMADRHERQAVQQRTDLTAEQIALQLQTQVETRLNLVRHLQADWGIRAPIDPLGFGADGGAARNLLDGIVWLDWVDAEGRVVPIDAHRFAPGTDAAAPRQDAATLAEARRSGDLRVTPPIDLLQGGRGFAVYAPVVANGRLEGLFHAAFHIDPLIDACLTQGARNGFFLRVEDDGQPIYGSDDGATATSFTATRTFDVGGRRWQVTLRPRPEQVVAGLSRIDELSGVLGLLVAGGLAWLCHWLASSRAQLRASVSERLQLEQRLHQAQKMEAVGTLASGVAHDFNNVLMAILGYSERARGLTGDHPEVQRCLEGIGEACRQASGVTRSLLMFGRTPDAGGRPVDFRAVLSETADMLHSMLPDAVRLIRDLPCDEPVWVAADVTQLQQVVINLAVNARDAMPGGGELRLTLRREWVGGEHGRGGREMAALVVADCGSGMSDEIRERVTEPFFTTKPRERGTGLGLSVVHGIVQRYEGELEIESTVGSGTRITVRVPCCPAPESKPGDQVAEAATRQGAECILLAEDNEQVRDVLVEMLRSVGYGVEIACDGAEALELFGELGDRLDLLLFDIDLPRMRGDDCLDHIRDAGSNLPAILISGDPRHAWEEQGRPDAMFLQKPFAMSELVRVVASAFAREEPSSARVDAPASIGGASSKTLR